MPNEYEKEAFAKQVEHADAVRKYAAEIAELQAIDQNERSSKEERRLEHCQKSLRYHAGKIHSAQMLSAYTPEKIEQNVRPGCLVARSYGMTYTHSTHYHENNVAA